MKCGTPGYVAPELLNNNAATTKIDIFSLGCVFFNLITLSFLFKGKNARDVLKDNQYTDPLIRISSKVNNVSLECKDLLKLML